MISVSNQFKDAVYAPIRKTSAVVTFEILDEESYEDNTITVSSEAEISKAAQITNKVRNMRFNYGTFEQDYFKLDGSFRIPPVPGEDDESEFGWWSNELSDETGVFIQNQIVELTFSTVHTAAGLTIIFNQNTNEYATDFDIDVYNNVDGLILHRTVTDNILPVFVFEESIDEYKRIVITIKKWSHPFRRAKIAEVDFGIIREYTDETLINLSILEELNIINDTIPSNELKFSVDNSDRAFNILNPTGIYRFLKERQTVNVMIGVEITENNFEYVNAGTYYLSEWQSDEGALITNFTAKDIFEFLESEDYVSILNTNLYDLTVDLFNKVGIKHYNIDKSLVDVPVNGFLEKINARTALQHIGIAGTCVVYQDRNKFVNVKKLSLLDEGTSYLSFVGNDFCGAVYPAVESGFDMRNITFDNVFQEPQITLDKQVKTVEIEMGESVVVVNDPNVKNGSTLKVSNPLITTAAHAQVVGQWILNESQLRALYVVDWRQNPALECGDIVVIEDSFGGKKQSRIVKQEFNYEGFLSGKTETKGGV